MKKKSIIIGLGIVIAAIAYLLFTSLGGTEQVYHLTVDKAVNGGFEPGKYYRIEGKLDVTKAQFDGTKNPVELKFELFAANNPAKKLTVIYNDIKPDNFAEATDAVVEGRFTQDGIFLADKMMVLRSATK